MLSPGEHLARPPRVLHVSQPVDAGVAHVVLDLLLDQQAAGWRVAVACPEGWLAERTRAAGVPWSRWDAARSPDHRALLESRRLARVVRSCSPDVVHLHSSKAGLAGRLALRGRLPTVFQPHAWSFAAATGAQGRAALAWERAGARWTTVLVCCSPEELDEGRAAGVAGAAQVLRNGVDLDRFASVSPAARAAARRALGLGEEPVAVVVGRLTRQKGQDVAAAAWPHVAAQLAGARLLLVGDGPERAAVAAAAGEGVALLGHRDDVPQVLAAADLVLLPSRWEGLPLALLEAMARGLPVVATDVAGSSSTLLDGDLPPAGEVVPVGDAAALAAAAVRRLQDPELRRREGAAARQRVERDHDLRRSTAQHRDLVAGLAAAGGAR